MSFRRVWIVLLVTGLVVFLCSRFVKNSITETSKSASGTTGAHDEKGKPHSAEEVSSSHKVREREPEKRPGISDMLASFNTPLPGLIEFPQQTLQERILATNALLKKTGIALRFGVDEEQDPSQSLLELQVPALLLENATPRLILLHDVNALKKDFFFNEEEGEVLFRENFGG
ncbi:hypothetical protein OKA05_12785 [Luteolibacter arcticus]|uniref:Uncharacterized protein n=1 Tax=Luteolibacter arcticus TaxID=1581411 RepID=A0ABT3GIT1_9BACT|nr:hypothetical protein [Luteolibacter arcticus]MCW1923433.1 hypothetical protein [Luteolibacter arcticus]